MLVVLIWALLLLVASVLLLLRRIKLHVKHCAQTRCMQSYALMFQALIMNSSGTRSICYGHHLHASHTAQQGT